MFSPCRGSPLSFLGYKAWKFLSRGDASIRYIPMHPAPQHVPYSPCGPRYDALHSSLDMVEAVLDSRYLRCGDCNERMSASDVLSHVCGGRFCRVHCGDCGLLVDGDRVSDHICGELGWPGSPSSPVWAGSPEAADLAAPAPAPSRSAPALRRQTRAPFTLADVHSRLELLCLELAVVLPHGRGDPAAVTPWWEIFTPDACEQAN